MNKKILALTICIMLCMTAMPASAFDTWHQFMKDSQNTGYSTSGAPDTNNILWVSEKLCANFSLVPSSSVALGQGKAFANAVAGDLDQYGNPGDETVGELVAFNMYTGEKVWNTTIDVPEWGSWSSPVYDDGYVFTSMGQDTICVNAATGAIKWIFTNPTGSASCNGGPIVVDDKVLCSDWEGYHYYCLNKSTGIELWSFEVSEKAQSTPAVQNGKIILTSWNDIYCLDMDGSLLWTKPCPSPTGNLCGSPSISGDIFYVTTYDFYSDDNPALFALDLNDGNEVWNATIQRTDSTPSIANGYLYVCGGCSNPLVSESQVSCFDALDGTLVWSTTKEWNGIGDWTISVSVADGKVFAGKADDSYIGQRGLYALDASTGAEVWHSDYAGGTAAISEDMVYSIGADAEDGMSYLYAFGETPSDWNPWNDADSDSDEYITFAEVMEAYNCFVGQTGAPKTGADIDFATVMEMYNAFVSQTPM
ncbi:PQQ-binding-like beta-propeller repeat protein [Methanolobus sp. ZRKC2]|uniref:PQQ-binding-like beta-propeller repeat protein n=1 Tax=Methanolobus sp. ZRKC2 TaxID=3125783 RepID=UPI003245B15E